VIRHLLMLFGIPLVVVAKLGVTVAIVGSTFDVVIGSPFLLRRRCPMRFDQRR
jgi:hypothetical protein